MQGTRNFGERVNSCSGKSVCKELRTLEKVLSL